ncbi:hypothetical protein CPLU01_12516, partial [Colletotrichum plurivorum]
LQLPTPANPPATHISTPHLTSANFKTVGGPPIRTVHGYLVDGSSLTGAALASLATTLARHEPYRPPLKRRRLVFPGGRGKGHAESLRILPPGIVDSPGHRGTIAGRFGSVQQLPWTEQLATWNVPSHWDSSLRGPFPFPLPLLPSSPRPLGPSAAVLPSQRLDATLRALDDGVPGEAC